MRINILRNMPGEFSWQRSFHDHIIGNEMPLNAIREYIAKKSDKLGTGYR